MRRDALCSRAPSWLRTPLPKGAACSLLARICPLPRCVRSSLIPGSCRTPAAFPPTSPPCSCFDAVSPECRWLCTGLLLSALVAPHYNLSPVHATWFAFQLVNIPWNLPACPARADNNSKHHGDLLSNGAHCWLGDRVNTSLEQSVRARIEPVDRDSRRRARWALSVGGM